MLDVQCQMKLDAHLIRKKRPLKVHPRGRKRRLNTNCGGVARGEPVECARARGPGRV